MRKSILLLLLVSALSSPIASAATEPSPDIKGLWLTADFPAAALRTGEEARFNISLINYRLAP